MKKRVIILILVALFVSVGLLVYLGQRKTQRSELYYSGTIEATQAHLAFQVVDIFGNDTMTIIEVSVGGKK
jgi:HlyD family secretion protein